MAAAVVLAFAPGAVAAATHTQSASSSGVTATLTWRGTVPTVSGLRLQIARAGQTVYNHAVAATDCATYCAPFSIRQAIHIVDLDGSGQPQVVIDLWSGGAHCCQVEQVFTFDSSTSTYTAASQDFGNYGAVLKRIGGAWRFVGADNRFAYAFTDYAGSGAPIQIFSFAGGAFHDVTRSDPALIARDAARWLRAYQGLARYHYTDGVGVIAAWAADEDALGRGVAVARYLDRQAALGHLRASSALNEPSGRRFIRALDRSLRRWGYLR